jgi:YegS/Rv2252/BmrU family lipid kinase
VPVRTVRPGRRWSRARRRFGLWDRRLITAAARRRSPASDAVFLAASRAANRSKLWVVIAGALYASGRRRPRSAAASGLLGIGFTSTLVNGPLKYAWRRDRPPIAFRRSGEPLAPLLPLPRTFSFPSGHSASAFAFATGATAALPASGPVVLPLAGAVAYSRVHTGVHYPSDVVVGSTIGVVCGLAAGRIVGRLRTRSVHRIDAAALDVEIPRRAVLLTADGSGSADDLAPATKVLEDGGFEIADVVAVDDADRLAQMLRDAGDKPPLVIAAGGDGTVCAAVNAIGEAPAVLAIIPLGTSNDVARSLGIPPDGREAAALLVQDARVSAVDAARIRLAGREQTFLNAATCGLNVAFAAEATDGSLRDRFGALTYPIAAARALRSYEPFECTLEHDGKQETLHLVHLSVSNAPVFGGVLGMRVPGASMTDGLLDVIAIERLSTARLVLAVTDSIIGRHRPVHRVHTMRVESLRVGAAAQEEIALDGEVIGELPAEFEVRPATVRVVVPATGAAG